MSTGGWESVFIGLSALFNSFLATGDRSAVSLKFANSLDPDQDHVGLDLDSNHLNL